MSTKALKRELLAAVAMLMVAIIALSGSTYAWFAANNTVEAQGLSVKATAEGGIEIAYTGGGGTPTYASSATANMSTAQELYPTSNILGVSDGAIDTDWFHASAQASTASDYKEGSATTLTGINGTAGVLDGKNYFIVKEFTIRPVEGTSTATGIYVDHIEVAEGAGTLNESLRVAVCTGSNKAVYAPNRASASSYNAIKSVTSQGSISSTASISYLTKTTSSPAIIAELTSGSSVKVNIYVWFEGQDSSNASMYVDTITDDKFSVVFKATKIE